MVFWEERFKHVQSLRCQISACVKRVGCFRPKHWKPRKYRRAQSSHTCVYVSPFVLLGRVALLLVRGRPHSQLYDARCPWGMMRKRRLISNWGDLVLLSHWGCLIEKVVLCVQPSRVTYNEAVLTSCRSQSGCLLRGEQSQAMQSCTPAGFAYVN